MRVTGGTSFPPFLPRRVCEQGEALIVDKVSINCFVTMPPYTEN
jgi:hypothetical protein